MISKIPKMYCEWMNLGLISYRTLTPSLRSSEAKQPNLNNSIPL